MVLQGFLQGLELVAGVLSLQFLLFVHFLAPGSLGLSLASEVGGWRHVELFSHGCLCWTHKLLQKAWSLYLGCPLFHECLAKLARGSVSSFLLILLIDKILERKVCLLLLAGVIDHSVDIDDLCVLIARLSIWISALERIFEINYLILLNLEAALSIGFSCSLQFPQRLLHFGLRRFHS